MKKRLYKETYKAGYNSRENATDIPFESCQTLVNARPGHPSPIPREGIVEWSAGLLNGDIPGEVIWSFPFKTSTENYLIILAKDDDDFGAQFFMRTNTSWAQIGTVFFFLTSKPAATRIKNSIYIVGLQPFGSSEIKSYIIDFLDGVFSLRLANLIRTPINIDAVLGGPGLPIPAGKFISIAATYVYRTDAGSFDIDGPLLCDLTTTIGFNPGTLESPDSIDDRVVLENDQSTDQQVVITSSGTQSYATHVRYYATDAQVSSVEAQGAAHKWIADVPITGVHAVSGGEYDYNVDAGVLEGDLDLLLVIGYDPIPQATALIYHNGRLWVGGAGSDEKVGRWFYSELPLDLEFPQKWLSMFREQTFFKDTSLENSDAGIGIGVSRGDLIFLMENSIWNLKSGDPDTFEPELIDSSNGTSFSRSITQIQRDLFYLGNNGPCMVAGREVLPIEAHTAGEVWPISKGQKGYFFTLADKKLVVGFFCNETWFLADESKIVGYYMPINSVSRGPWEIRPQDPLVKIKHANSFDSDTCMVISSLTTTPRIYQILKSGERQDLGLNYYIRSRSMALLYAGRDRDQAGEAFDVILNAHWTDLRKMDVVVRSNYFRYRFGGRYDETPPTDGLSDNKKATAFDLAPIWRYSARQGFPEGLVGNHFEVEWVKEFASPWDFECSGFVLRVNPAYAQPLEFLSRDLGEGLLEYGADITFLCLFDANSDILEDEGPFGYTHTFASLDGLATRTYTPTMIPSGGDELTASEQSGFLSNSWDGMDDGLQSIIDGGVGEFTRQFIFYADGTDQILEAIGDGDGIPFYAVNVKTNGDILFGFQGDSLTKTYTAAGAIASFSQQYILQLSMRVAVAGQDPEVQLYVGLRSAAFPTAKTVTDADTLLIIRSYPAFAVHAFGFASSLKISYARGMQTFLTAERAQSFHEAMRAKSL